MGQTPAKEKFEAIKRLLPREGAHGGLHHKRLVIPKQVLSPAEVKELGFFPVIVAAPESGQNQIVSYRHPEQYHLHSHGDRWTLHQDDLPVSAVTARKAKTLAKKVWANVEGIPHATLEGGLGWVQWAKQKAQGKRVAEEVAREMDPRTHRKILSLEKRAEPEKVERAIADHAVGSYRELEKKLRPGDILTTAPDKRFDSFFYTRIFKPVSRLAQGTDFGHAAYYAGKGEVIHGNNSGGFHRVSLRDLARKNSIIAVRLKRPEKGEVARATEYAEKTVGRKFDIPAVLRAATPFRGERKRKLVDADRLICSGMIANAYARRKFGKADRLTTRPSDILESDEVRPVAARILPSHQKG